MNGASRSISIPAQFPHRFVRSLCSYASCRVLCVLISFIYRCSAKAKLAPLIIKRRTFSSQNIFIYYTRMRRTMHEDDCDWCRRSLFGGIFDFQVENISGVRVYMCFVWITKMKIKYEQCCMMMVHWVDGVEGRRVALAVALLSVAMRKQPEKYYLRFKRTFVVIMPFYNRKKFRSSTACRFVRWIPFSKLKSLFRLGCITYGGHRGVEQGSAPD